MEEFMITQFTADQLQGRFECFSQFNRHDRLCLKYCGLNIRCALAKQEWFDQEGFEDYPQSFAPIDTDFGPGEG